MFIWTSPALRPRAQQGATVQSGSFTAAAVRAACTDGIASKETMRPVNPHLRMEAAYCPAFAPTSKMVAGRETLRNLRRTMSSGLE